MKRVGGMAQGVGPEVKLQYHKKKQNTWNGANSKMRTFYTMKNDKFSYAPS
jgi:hypothetical protein